MITQEEKDSIAHANYELGVAFGRDEGIALGLAKGREEGRAEGIRDVARKLLETGIPADKVAEVTGIPREQLR